jgi:flagellar hook-associated protein 3 FlgL
MRVTSSSFPRLLGNQLTELATKQARLQAQAGTGQRFSISSEDPRSMRTVMDLQSEIKSLGQYDKNIARLRDTLDTSYTVTSHLKKVSDRANEIATLAEGIRTDDELGAYANEIDQLIDQGVQLANSRHQGTYLFAGTDNQAAPFVSNRDASGKITSVQYNGSTSVAEIEIDQGVSLAVNIPGANSTGSGLRGLLTDSQNGADFFGHLISLRDNLKAGNSAAIAATDLPNLLKDEENFVYHYGFIGAAQARLETTAKIGEQRKLSLEGLVSREADADLASTLVSLNEIQNAYMAALKTGGTILSQSLLDYLR